LAQLINAAKAFAFAAFLAFAMLMFLRMSSILKAVSYRIFLSIASFFFPIPSFFFRIFSRHRRLQQNGITRPSFHHYWWLAATSGLIGQRAIWRFRHPEFLCRY
jgi:amino acid permease